MEPNDAEQTECTVTLLEGAEKTVSREIHKRQGNSGSEYPGEEL